jgi:hypothetical protein
MRHASRVAVGSPAARVAALAAVMMLLALLATGALVAGAGLTSPVPTEQRAAPQPPVEFTGTWCVGPPVTPERAGTNERLQIGDDGLPLVRYRHGAWRNAVSMSDPRLQGDAYQTYETDNYSTLDIGVIALTSGIVNEDGAWTQRLYQGMDTLAPTPDGYVYAPDGLPLSAAYIGEGAYEGLIAVMVNGAEVRRPDDIAAQFGPCSEVHGFIFDGALAEPYPLP